MRTHIGILLSLTILIGLSNPIHCQSEFQVHLGPSIPLSNFGLYEVHFETGKTINSNAIVGINSGFQYSYRFHTSNFGYYCGIDFFYNRVNKEYRSFIEDFYYPSEIKHHAYINVPVSAGMIYDYEVTDNISLLGSVGVTLNFLKVSDQVLAYRTESDLAYSLGGRIGLGIMYGSRYSFHIDYYGLGNHEVVSHYSRVVEDEISEKLSVQILTVNVGLVF